MNFSVCVDDMFGMDCKVPAVNVSNECGRQEVVQRSLDALGHRSLAREDLEAQNPGLLGCWAHCTLESFGNVCRQSSRTLPEMMASTVPRLGSDFDVNLFLVDLPWSTGPV